jgi:hypothetical protein
MRPEKPIKLTAKLALCWLAAFGPVPAHGQAVVDWMQAARGSQHLVFPRYTEPEKTLYAVISVDKVSIEYEKHGFFRIGALPVEVLEGVTYEVRDPVPAANNLARLRSWLGGDTGDHVELRGVKLVASSTSRLEGGRLLFLDHDRWEFTGGVRLISGANQFQAPSATLQVAGANAGELILQTTPPSTNTFLFGTHSRIPNPTIVKTASK